MPALGYAGDLALQAPAETDWPAVTLVPTGWGVRRQTFITNAGDGSGRLFLVQQDGQIWIVKNNQILAQPFLDISQRVACCGEQGLLSVAFPPDYASSGVFYVFYTRNDGYSVVARHFVSAEDPDRADPNRSQTVLRVTNERVFHNGGHLAFGPDTYLYLSLGDDGFDTWAQQLNRFHGKVLRIDVQVQPGQAEPPRLSTSHTVFLPAVSARVGFTYRIPPSNPFVQTPGALGEIWAYGLRNPWRFAFDGATGDLYLADVGEYVTEEVDFRPASSPGGENYGWPVMEGSRCRTDPSCDPAPYILPVAEYGHTDGQCAVIGGVVYRGTGIPGLDGAYLFGDFCTGRLWGMRRVVDSWETTLLADAPYGISSIGVDESGEVYVVEFGSQRVRRLEPATTLLSPS
jgi:glucose/arabinose dehydrogenase